MNVRGPGDKDKMIIINIIISMFLFKGKIILIIHKAL